MRKLLFAVIVAALALLPGAAQVVADPPPGWGISSTAKVTQTPVSPDGTVILLDLPKQLHMRNSGGSDGAGLCVFTSINMSAYWQNVPQLWRYQEWAKRHPGGSYPQKTDATIDQICKEMGVKKPAYIQIESADIEPLKLAIKTGRMPAVTYSWSPTGRYGGRKIPHMATLLHLDDRIACIMDNNFPGSYEWMSVDEFRQSYTGGGRNGWAVVLLNPGPPPPPKN